MKKILTIIMAIFVMTSFVACSDNADKEVSKNTDSAADESITENHAPSDAVIDEEIQADEEKAEAPKDDKQENSANAQTQSPKPQQSTQSQTQVQTPEEKPAQSQKPAESPAPDTSTLGKTLLADFKAKAASGMDAQQIADALLTNPAIKFNGGAIPVEEGYLSGFDNAEIKGFKSGVMFAPMIGSIAFVGYVFELDNAGDVPAFIANLEKNANLRWNICVEADEMVTGSAGNKVFFVMCPTSLEG